MLNNKILSKGNISDAVPKISHATPVIASGDNVSMVWFENVTGDRINNNKSDVFFRASNDNGNTLGPIINLSRSPNATSDDPHMSSDGNDVHVTFWDDRPKIRKPFVVNSHDGGQTFGPPIMLNATAR